MSNLCAKFGFLSSGVAVFFFACVSLVPTDSIAAPSVGALAPDFEATDSEGNIRSLGAYKDKIVVLEWTNHDCPFVRKHYESGNIQSLQAEAKEEDVVWFSIISSAPGKQGYVTPEEANALTESRNASPTAVILDPDGEIGHLYAARTTPHMFVINPQGILAYMGGIDDTPSADKADVVTAQNYVRPAIVAVQAGETPETVSSKPYGCSVKYAD